MRDTQMITFNFKIIVEIANGGDAVKQVVYMHKFRERGFIRRPTYVAYLATKLPRFPYHQQQWMDPRTLQNWINRQDNQFNCQRFSMQPTSDPSLRKYSKVYQRGPEEMLWTAQRDPLDNWMRAQTVTKSSDKDIKKREEEENNKTQNNFSPVAPGTLIILWRDLEKRRQGEPFGVQCNLLTRVLPPRDTKWGGTEVREQVNASFDRRKLTEEFFNLNNRCIDKLVVKNKWAKLYLLLYYCQTFKICCISFMRRWRSKKALYIYYYFITFVRLQQFRSIQIRLIQSI